MKMNRAKISNKIGNPPSEKFYNEHQSFAGSRDESRISLAVFNFPRRELARSSSEVAVVARRCLEAKRAAWKEEKGGDEKEKRVETTKGWVGGQAKTATSDSSKQQRQHDSRWLARHCSLPALYFFPLIRPTSSSVSSATSSSSSSLVRVSERRAPWALLCLSSALRSFVLFRAPLEGLIAAHTRSPFVSSFCHLPSTLSPSLSLRLYSLAPAQPPSVHVFLSFLASTPTDTTDHEGGLLSHSPLFLHSRTRLPYLLLFLSSLSCRSRLPP